MCSFGGGGGGFNSNEHRSFETKCRQFATAPNGPGLKLNFCEPYVDMPSRQTRQQSFRCAVLHATCLLFLAQREPWDCCHDIKLHDPEPARHNYDPYSGYMEIFLHVSCWLLSRAVVSGARKRIPGACM